MSDKTTTAAKPAGNSKKAIVLLIVVFLLGIITGVGGSAMMMVQRIQSTLKNPELAEGPAGRVLHRIEDDLVDHLDLSDAERDAVHEELTKGHLELRGTRVELIEEVRGVVDDTVTRIESRLPEDKHEALRQRVHEKLEPWGLHPAD